MRILKQACIVLSLVLGTLAGAAAPEIRFVSEAPYADGKIQEGVWSKADILSGFLVPGKLMTEMSKTECSMLFDDQNVYILLKGFFMPDFNTGDKSGKTLFEDNHFEVFLMPGAQAGEYIHFAVSRKGNKYLARNYGGKTEKLDPALVQTYIKKEWHYWQALVIIPFPVLKIDPPKEDLTFKFNVCRCNVDLPAGKIENSSFAAMDFENFHNVQRWGEAKFTRKEGIPQAIYASNDNFNLNLIPNYDFSVGEGNLVPGWYVSKIGVNRKETSEFSGQWVMRGTGKAYQMLSVNVPSLKEGVTYTLRIKARQFGSPNAIGVMQMCGRPDGKGVMEGSSAIWRMPVTDDFREYAVPFKADKNVKSLSFYRFGPDREDSGIDYASIQLFEGKLSSFEIRKVSRLDRKAVVPGTEMNPAPNRYGSAKEKIRVLAVCPDSSSTREPMEIFSGLNAECDSLITTTPDSDLYYTDNDPRVIQKKLEDSSYDVYMIGFNLDRVGKELSAQIQKNVEKGAGLVLANPFKRGNFETFLKKHLSSGSSEIPAAAKGFPSQFFVFTQAIKGMGTVPGFQEGGKAGKGNIVIYTASYPTAFLFNEKADADSIFPYQDYAKVWLARLIFHAAGKKLLLAKYDISNGKITFSGLENAAGAVAKWDMLDSAGEHVASGRETVGNGTLSITPKMVMSGYHLLIVQLMDSDGKVLDCSMLPLCNEGPAITKLLDAKRFNTAAQQGNFTCNIDGYASGMTLEWNLEDSSGRILEKGTVQGASSMNFSVPLNTTYSNLARLRAFLKKDGKVLDVKRIPVYVQDRDRARMLNDFTTSVWPVDTNLSAEYEKDTCRQLENIGIRAVGFSNRDRTNILSTGMGLVAGAALGGGEIFCAYKQNSNVRSQQFNTAESRKQIAAQAEERAAKVRVFGSISNQVCDEPQLARPFESDELDSHPENLTEYRLRMERKYGTIGKFNERCGTAYRSFAELQPGLIADARKTGRFAEFIEWRNFNTDRWCEILKLMSDSAKKQDADALFTLPNTAGQMSLNGNDYWKMLTQAGNNLSQEYTSMVYMGSRENPSPLYDFDELYRSFAPEMRVWGWIGYVNSTPRLMFQPMWFAAHRYGGFSWFAVHCALVRDGALNPCWNLLDLPGNGLTQDAADLKKSLDSTHLLTGLGKLFLDYQWVPRDASIYYSQESMLTSFCLGTETKNGEISRAGGPHHDYYYSRHGIRYMLESMLFQYDFVAPEQVIGGQLKKRKVLFMPYIISLSDAEVNALKKFLSDGGTIVADFQPGIYDELGMKRNKAPLADIPGLHVIGGIFNDMDSAQSGNISGFLDKAGVKPVLNSSISGILPGREAIHFRKGQMNVFVVLRNPIKAAGGNMAQTVTFPMKGHLYNLLDGKYLGVTQQADIVLNDSTPAAVFGIYPYRVTSVSLDMPESIKAGQDIAAKIQVKTDGAAPGSHVFHVEVIPPDGKTTLLMKRNLSAENGSADFRFRMAFNDPKGKWTLHVRDVMSGTVEEKKFTIE